MTSYLMVIVPLSIVQCYGINSPIDLVLEYCKEHHPLQRPVLDQKTILNISVNLNLLRIEDLDETKQQLTTTSWFYFIWTMEGLTWDMTKFQNISRVHVFPKDMYLPDLVLLNAVDDYGQLGGGNLPVTVWSNGTVEWYAANLRTTSCKVDVTRFPFDHQQCSIRLSQWFTFSSEVRYSFLEPPVTFRGFKENGEWQILNFSASLEYAYDGLYQVLTFDVTLRRRHAYYILTAVLPACVLSILSLLVFHVPPGSGEKLALCVSILLSYAVYLTSITSILPSVSDNVALFSIYLICMFVLKAFIVAASVFVLYLQFAPDEVIAWMMPRMKRLLFSKLSTVPDYQETDDEVKKLHDLEMFRKHLIKRTDRLLFCISLFSFLACTFGFIIAFMS